MGYTLEQLRAAEQKRDAAWERVEALRKELSEVDPEDTFLSQLVAEDLTAAEFEYACADEYVDDIVIDRYEESRCCY